MTSKELGSPNRLAALEATQLLDTQRDTDFDQLTRLAAHLLRVPHALVTLVTSDRQYVKSAADNSGEATHPAGSSQTLGDSFCKFAVASGESFIVEDAREHPLVRDSAAVANGVIAYAGVPLKADGEAIGALCVIDSRPRKWSTDEIATLRALARSAMRLVQEKNLIPEVARHSFAADSTQLLTCLTAHLRSLATYEELLVKDQIDPERETAARDEVVASFDRLSEAFDANKEQADDELRELILTYVERERQRAEAIQSFAHGRTNLAELQALITAQNDTLAALRIAALDRGGEL